MILIAHVLTNSHCDSLARLSVAMDDGTLIVKTRNVLAFSINPALFSMSMGQLLIDNTPVDLHGQLEASQFTFVLRHHSWHVSQMMEYTQLFPLTTVLLDGE